MTGPGEARHEQCRYGILTPCIRLWGPEAQEKDVIPLCTWRVPDPAPPWVTRALGGAVEPETDCAACPCFREVNP